MSKAEELAALQRDNLELVEELVRVKELLGLEPLEDGRSVRVEMLLNEAKHPKLVVTAPTHWDEAKLGDVIGGVLQLWFAVEGSLREREGHRSVLAQQRQALVDAGVSSGALDTAMEPLLTWYEHVHGVKYEPPV